MIEKIGNLAERLATNVSESRRGFLTRVGQAALGVAGALGGLLALPGAAQAKPPGGRRGYGYCVVRQDDRTGGWYGTSRCLDVRNCQQGFSSECVSIATQVVQGACNNRYSPTSICSF